MSDDYPLPKHRHQIIRLGPDICSRASASLEGRMWEQYPQNIEELRALADAMEESHRQRRMEILCTEIHLYGHARDYGGCNRFLVKFNPDKEHPIVGIAILRASFAMRKQLPEWSGLAKRVWYLLRHDDRREHLMKGLL